MPNARNTGTMLSEAQHQFYAENGYLVLERVIGDNWVQNLRQAGNRILQQSRARDSSESDWHLGREHSARVPRLLALANPEGPQPVFWDYLVQSVVPDILVDLLGPDVKFHHAELVFEPDDGDEDGIRWRQDAPYWPHTNYSPCTVVTHLYECTGEQRPLMVLPGSHLGDLYAPVDGTLSALDVAGLDVSAAVPLVVPGGSVTIHNCRLVHGYAPGTTGVGRPVLWSSFSTADAFPYGNNAHPSPMTGTIIRGAAARWARHDPRPCPVPVIGEED